MPTREIARNDWTDFFASFSRQHDGWLSTIEVYGSNAPALVEVRDKPFTGITLDRSDDKEDVISILVGGESQDHVARVIHAPVCVRVTETNEGVYEALQIESRHGPTTRLRFRSVMPPELVDGVVLGR